MSFKAAISVVNLIMLIFCIVGTTFGADTDLVTTGQKVTLTAPSGDYLYQWTAEADGGTLALGDQQSFTFVAPDVSQTDQMKIVSVVMLIRSIKGGCVNQKTAEIPVYALPACGIGGPSSASPESSLTYSYEGGATGKLSYEWSVDNESIDGSNAPSVTIDWSKYSPTDHTVALKISKDYSDVVPGAPNPTRDVTCSYPVTIAYTSAIQVSKIPSRTSASVGETITYNYSVKNTGSIAVKGLSLTDDKLGSITLDKADLSPGGVATGTSRHTITENDLPGPLMNNVIASGTDRSGKPLTSTGNASVALTYVSAFTVDKKASQATAKLVHGEGFFGKETKISVIQVPTIVTPSWWKPYQNCKTQTIWPLPWGILVCKESPKHAVFVYQTADMEAVMLANGERIPIKPECSFPVISTPIEALTLS